MKAGLRQCGIDARLALFVPLATAATVLATALIYSLIGGLAEPRAILPALYLFTLMGLVAAVFAFPLTLPLSLAAWTISFTLLRRRGLAEPRAAAICAALAGLAGAIGFSLWAGLWGGAAPVPGIFVLVLPGSILGAIVAARALYRGQTA